MHRSSHEPAPYAAAMQRRAAGCLAEVSCLAAGAPARRSGGGGGFHLSQGFWPDAKFSRLALADGKADEHRAGLDELRGCLEGIRPAASPPATLPRHAQRYLRVRSLMYCGPAARGPVLQFFNKTPRNILANPVATVLDDGPDTARPHCPTVATCALEACRPVSERSTRASWRIAPTTGMECMLLLGATLWVQAIEAVPGREPCSIAHGPRAAACDAQAQRG